MSIEQTNKPRKTRKPRAAAEVAEKKPATRKSRSTKQSHSEQEPPTSAKRTRKRMKKEPEITVIPVETPAVSPALEAAAPKKATKPAPRKRAANTTKSKQKVTVSQVPAANSVAVAMEEVQVIPEATDLNGATTVLGEAVTEGSVPGGTAVQNQITQPLQTVLPIRAVKVKEIVARIRNITAEVIQDKVIIQGIVHKQIFFVSTDMIVRHIAEDAPFSTFLDLPGAAPGMNVNVRAVIEGVLFKLLPDGLTLDQKVVIQIFVKVTETVQVQAVPGTGPLVKIEEVVGENSGQTLVENEIALGVPAVKVAEIQATVRDITAEVILNKVVIQGVLHKQIFFVGTDNLERHLAEDVPFSTFVDVPGASPGMNVHVRSEVETILFELLSPTLLLQRVVLQFFVKVTQTVQLRITEGVGPLFRLAEVIGENTEQILSESTVALTRPAVKVREIVARVQDVTAKAILNKIVIQGILHKQIYYIGLDNVEYHQAEDVPFSLFMDIPGTAPGMDIQVHAVIEHIMFELEGQTLLRQKVVIQFFAKVTQEIQFRMAVGQGPLVKVEQVIGENVRQVLVRVVRRIIPPLPPPPTPPPPAVLGVVQIVIPGAEAIVTEQVLVENAVQLPVPAIKIRSVTGRIINLQAQIVPDAILVTGVVHKSVDFVGTDDIVRNIQENVAFSVLVPAPGITPATPVQIRAEIENISFSLTQGGMMLNQVIVIRATAALGTTPSRVVQVVTSVDFPGVQTTTLLVRALVLRDTVPQLEEITVVTNAFGPGVLAIQREVIPLDVVGDGLPFPVPVEVVTDITLGPI